MSKSIENGKNVVMNTYSRNPVVMEKGEGVYVYDEAGKKYLDFVAGIAVNSLGHGHPKLSETIADQAKSMIHVSNLYWTKQQVELAGLLVRNSCFDKAFFCNSGAEAIEGSLKLVRKYADKNNSGKTDIISMEHSFHGRTYGAVTATGQAKYQKGLSPMLPGITHAAFNNLEAVLNSITDKTGAILVEPVQGEGGIRPADKAFLQGLRDVCDEKDIILIFDEVQCGVGRIGKLFAYEYFDVEPDVLVTAKGLAGGVPIGALLAKDKFASAFNPGDHASTFGGNPLATSAGLVVVNELLGGLLQQVQKTGAYLNKRLNELKQKTSVITDVRGIGLMQGIELSEPVSEIISKCMENGLLLVNAGTHIIRFVPPLIVTEKDIDIAIDILEKSI